MGQCQSNDTEVFKMRNQQLVIDNNNLKLQLEKYSSKTESDETNLKLAKLEANTAITDLCQANQQISSLEQEIDSKNHEILVMNQNIEHQTQIIKDKTEQHDQNIEVTQQLQIQLTAAEAALNKKKPSFLRRTFTMKS